jgi:hypothetical protein
MGKVPDGEGNHEKMNHGSQATSTENAQYAKSIQSSDKLRQPATSTEYRGGDKYEEK